LLELAARWQLKRLKLKAFERQHALVSFLDGAYNSAGLAWSASLIAGRCRADVHQTSGLDDEFLSEGFVPYVCSAEFGSVSKERNIVQSKRIRRNEEITTPEVRVIGANGEQVGVMDIRDALARAQEAEMDLVEVAPNSEPPVCRVMDYGKFVFEQNKKAQSARRKQKQTQVKEIKFRPGTEEGDYQIKLRNLVRFLSGGDKTKVTLRFRGREMAHQELGVELLRRVQKDLEEFGTVEQYPQLEGRQMIMVISPKKRPVG
jgi:translation initiation factor IF-3